MPAISRSQQRLFGQAYALKTGDIKLKDLDPRYKSRIRKLAKSMTEKQLKDFASTKHKKLPEKVEEKKLVHLKTFENFNQMNEDVSPEDPVFRKSSTGKAVIYAPEAEKQYLRINLAGVDTKNFQSAVTEVINFCKSIKNSEGKVIWLPTITDLSGINLKNVKDILDNMKTELLSAHGGVQNPYKRILVGVDTLEKMAIKIKDSGVSFADTIKEAKEAIKKFLGIN